MMIHPNQHRTEEYMEIYTNNILNSKGTLQDTTMEKYNNIIETLKYNKILISKSDIRDKKISYVLDEDEPF